MTLNSHISRASYVKDYALKFRTDKDLTESFHYLVYRYGNKYYELFKKDKRTDEEDKTLEDGQSGVKAELRFFDPKNIIGQEQEMRLDNLLGFFDAIGYDLRRGLLSVKDVAGIFGYHLDHLIQRDVVQDYLENIQKEWPSKKTFHERYGAPTPYKYLRYTLTEYERYRKRNDEKRTKNRDSDL